MWLSGSWGSRFQWYNFKGMPESVMERLYRTISDFDRSWSSKSICASDEQIQQLENICSVEWK